MLPVVRWNGRNVPPYSPWKIYAFFHCDGVLQTFLSGLAWNHNPPDISLPCSLLWHKLVEEGSREHFAPGSYLFIYLLAELGLKLGFAIERQALYCLIHSSSPSCSVYFRYRDSLFAQVCLDPSPPILSFCCFWDDRRVIQVKPGEYFLVCLSAMFIVIFFSFPCKFVLK
jgi:hypothetical protein